MENKEGALRQNYMAFISYSHADNREEGRKWADWLHHALETYEIPAELVGTKNQRGEVIPQQIYPVFQDEKELSASSNLGTSLQAALTGSKTLVFLSSPNSARSSYVIDELTFFKKTGRADDLIALIISGEPEYGELITERQCFPEVLRFKLDAEGIITTEREEPLAADVRRPEDSGEGFTSAEAYRRYLEKEKPGITQADLSAATETYRVRLELAKLKIIAGVLKVPLGELTKRDKAYQLEKIQAKNRRIKRVATAIGALAVLAVIAGIFAWTQKNKAVATLAKSLYVSGIELADKGEMADAGAYIAQAIRYGDRGAARFGQSMLLTQGTTALIPNADGGAPRIFSPNGRLVITMVPAGQSKLYLQAWDAVNNRFVAKLPEVPVMSSSIVKATTDDKVYFFDAKARLWKWDVFKERAVLTCSRGDSAKVAAFNISDDGRLAGVLYNDNTYTVFDTGSGRQLIPMQTATADMAAVNFFFPGNPNAVVITDEGSPFAKHAPEVHAFRFVNGKALQADFTFPHNRPSVTFSANGERFVLYTPGFAQAFDLRLDVSPRVLPHHGLINSVYFNGVGNTITLNDSLTNVLDFSTALVKQSYPRNQGLDALTNYGMEETTSPTLEKQLIIINNRVFVTSNGVSPLLLASREPGKPARNIIAGPGGMVLISYYDTKNVERWLPLAKKIEPNAIVPPDTIVNMQAVPGTNYIAASTKSGALFYNALTGKPAGQEIKLQNSKQPFAFNEAGTLMRAGVGNGIIKLYSVPAGRQVGIIQKPKATRLISSPDFSLLFFRDDDNRWRVMADNGARVLYSGSGNVSGARFSSNNKYLLVIYTGGTAELREASNGNIVFKPRTTQEAVGDFSSANDMFALSEDLYSTRIWSVKEHRPAGQSVKAGASAKYFRFTDDGRGIMAYDRTGKDGMFSAFRLYDAYSGYPLTMPFATTSAVNATVFPDGKLAMTSERNNGLPVIAVWEVPGESEANKDKLADDIENFYGRKYDTRTGALYSITRKPDPGNWYFQNLFTRTVTPNVKDKPDQIIESMLPLKSEQQVRSLSKNYLYHPLAKAAIAQYYARQPQAVYIAEYFINAASLQQPQLADAQLKARVGKVLAEAKRTVQAQPSAQ